MLSDILSFICILLGTVFVIRISSFKKDAWIFYLLATLIGVVGLTAFDSQFTFKNLGINFTLCLHDIILASTGIYFFYFRHISIKNIKNIKQFSRCLLLILFAAILLFIWTCIYQKILFDSYPVFYNLALFILGGLIAFIGSVLLLRGYILGFIISAFSEATTLIFYFSYGFNSNYIMPAFFHTVNLIIFIYAYKKYR